MKKLLALILVVIASGCANVGSIQADCERQNSSFTGMAACMKKQIQDNRRLANNDTVQLYVLKSEQLSAQLAAGKITEVDARFELKKLMVALKRQEDDDTPVIAPARGKVDATCSTYGTVTSCTSR